MMQTNTRQTSIIVTVLSLVLAFIAWIALAPTQLGGKVLYVIVDGNSMESKFHLGDLVLIRQAVVYQIGDAVTYQNAEMGRFVFHRIIDLNLDRFVLKGDNNSWSDSYQPTSEEIVGKLWVHIPKLGKAIQWLRLPVNLAITVGLLGGSLMYSMMIQPSKKEKGKVKLPAASGGILEIAMYGLGFLALAFLALSIFAFTRPLATSMDSISYQQEGKFFYSAAGAPGIYDTDKVRSGEPIFPKLTCYLNVGFAYNVAAVQLQEITGSQHLYARILDEKSGWRRTIPMTSESVFNGNSFLVTSTLDLCQVQALISMVEQETGLHENSYTLEVAAPVAITAKSAEEVISDSFEPAMVFKFDEVHFYLASNDGQEDLLRFSKQGQTGGTAKQASTVAVFGQRPTVQSVRIIGLTGLLISLISLLGMGWLLFKGTRDNLETYIRLKYGMLLMEIQEHGFEVTSPVIDVNNIDDLARMAERQNTMILHMNFNFTNYYLVQTQGMTYRYTVSNDKRGTIELETARSKTLNHMVAIGANRKIAPEPLQHKIFNDMFETEANPIPRTDTTRKVILRYALNADGNSDLQFE
jgi:signal peptidase I